MKEMEVCAAVTKFPVTADVTGDGFGAVEDVTELSDQKREKWNSRWLFVSQKKMNLTKLKF